MDSRPRVLGWQPALAKGPPMDISPAPQVSHSFVFQAADQRPSKRIAQTVLELPPLLTEFPSSDLPPEIKPHIPRPQNAFMLFRGDWIKRYRRRSRSTPNTKTAYSKDLSKEVGKAWRALSPSEKDTWNIKAQEVKKEHHKLYPDYKYCPQPRKPKNRGSSLVSSKDPKAPEQHRPSHAAATQTEPSATIEVAPCTIPSQGYPSSGSSSRADIVVPPPFLRRAHSYEEDLSMSWATFVDGSVDDAQQELSWNTFNESSNFSGSVVPPALTAPTLSPIEAVANNIDSTSLNEWNGQGNCPEVNTLPMYSPHSASSFRTDKNPWNDEPQSGLPNSSIQGASNHDYQTMCSSSEGPYQRGPMATNPWPPDEPYRPQPRPYSSHAYPIQLYPHSEDQQNYLNYYYHGLDQMSQYPSALPEQGVQPNVPDELYLYSARR